MQYKLCCGLVSCIFHAGNPCCLMEFKFRKFISNFVAAIIIVIYYYHNLYPSIHLYIAISSEDAYTAFVNSLKSGKAHHNKFLLLT